MLLSRRTTVLGLLTASAPFAKARASLHVPAGGLDAHPAPFVLHPELAPSDAPPVVQPVPTWRRNAVSVAVDDPRPKIAVVVDDMGATHPWTGRVMALTGPLTLAWFPFAPNLERQVAEAADRGHEAMLHMPMQSFSNSTAQTGPDPLRVDLPADVNAARLRAAIAAVPNTVGLNNHMGSVATRDAALMDIVARAALDHGMLFLDSVTIPHSVALARAEIAGVPAAARDVFIDHVGNAAIIAGQLASIEQMARQNGYAIAIGHPRPRTVEALEWWLPTLENKGFVLWPIAATVALRNRMEIPRV